MPEPHEASPDGAGVDDSEERVGPFPSWKSLYITVVIYAFALIALLAYLTVRLDFSG